MCQSEYTTQAYNFLRVHVGDNGSLQCETVVFSVIKLF